MSETKKTISGLIRSIAFLCLCYIITGLSNFLTAIPELKTTSLDFLTISPAVKTVNVAPGASSFIFYQVTNTSGMVLSSLTYYPPILSTLSSGTSCGPILSPGDSCNVAVLFTAPLHQQQPFVLEPLIACAGLGAFCSVPTTPIIVTMASPTALLPLPTGTLAFAAMNCIDASCSQGVVKVIASATNSVVATIPLSGSSPHTIVASRDNKRLFVTLTGSNTVSVIDVASGREIAVVPSLGVGPEDMVVSPTQDRIFLLNAISQNLTIIDSDSLTAVAYNLPAGASGPSILVTTGDRIFIANTISVNYSIFDTSTNTFEPNLTPGLVPNPSSAMTLTPDLTTLISSTF